MPYSVLRQPPGLSAGPGGEGVRGDAVVRGIGRVPAPPPHLCLGQGVEILPAADRAEDVCQFLVSDGPVNER